MAVLGPGCLAASPVGMCSVDTGVLTARSRFSTGMRSCWCLTCERSGGAVESGGDICACC